MYNTNLKIIVLNNTHYHDKKMFTFKNTTEVFYLMQKITISIKTLYISCWNIMLNRKKEYQVVLHK